MFAADSGRVKHEGQYRLDAELQGAAQENTQMPIHEEVEEAENTDQIRKVEETEPVPKYDGPGYAVIHRGQKPIPKPMPEPQASQAQKKPQAAAMKPPLQAQPRGGVIDPEKSVISNAPSNAPSGTGSRISSRSRGRLLKSDILSKEEEARQIKEKKDKMDEIKSRYSRRSRQNSNSATRPPQQQIKRTPS